MAKFHGVIGFAEQYETRPGVWSEKIIERQYRGDIIRNIRQREPGEGLNDDVRLNNVLEIVANPYLRENLARVRYVKWMGTAWRITNVEVRYPRLVLTLGGAYNGKQA